MKDKDSKARLGREDWVLAGFRALVRGGPAGLRIEAMAREMGATKGSFYWHFKDMADLQAAMLVTWADLATTQITRFVQRSGRDGRGQVMLLIDMVSVLPGDEVGGPAAEPAIRDWGRTYAAARAVLERVDRQRLADLSGFLCAAGLTEARAGIGALRLYAAILGLQHLRLTTGAEMRPALLAIAEDILRPVDAAPAS